MVRENLCDMLSYFKEKKTISKGTVRVFLCSNQPGKSQMADVRI